MFNKLAHVAIGFYVGVKLQQKEFNKAWLVTGVFGAYQTLEQRVKHDQAYPEIKEFGVGVGLGIASRRGTEWLLRLSKHSRD